MILPLCRRAHLPAVLLHCRERGRLADVPHRVHHLPLRHAHRHVPQRHRHQRQNRTGRHLVSTRDHSPVHAQKHRNSRDSNQQLPFHVPVQLPDFQSLGTEVRRGSWIALLHRSSTPGSHGGKNHSCKLFF
jgi:hypothetical protein